MVQVETKYGLIDRGRLVYRDEIAEDENQITTVRNWYLDGEFVRNSVWVDVFRGIGAEVKGSMNGG